MAKTATHSKTVWFNSVVAGLETVLFLLGKEVIPLDPATQASIILAINAVVNIILRFKTAEPIELKKYKSAIYFKL
ncbi:MAG: hypothetical protein ACFE9S_07445 [Candidatus Hermodarchaeota archaeon]